MARRATVIDQARRDHEHVLLLDAGEALLNDRSPAKSSRGATSVAALNRMAYDAVALGQRDLSLLTAEELRVRLSEAQFPVLSANASWRANGELAAETHVILQVADHQVAILGLTEPGDTDAVTVSDPLTAAQAWVPKLRREADIVILISHAGLEANRKIAAQLPGIDLIVSGGGIDGGAHKSGGALVAQAEVPTAGNAAKIVGVASLRFDESGELRQHQWERVVLTPEIAEDAEMAEWLRTVRVDSP